MAKVIDRLRVQGISPSRESSFSSRDEMLRPTMLPNPQTDKSWIPNGDGFCMSGQRQSKDFLTSNTNPAARRAEVIMRMRTANQGLSTMDSNFGPSSVQFVLRGKHVRNQIERPLTPGKVLPDRVLPPPRTSSQDPGLERQIKVHIGKARSEPVSGGVVDKVSKESTTKDDSSLPSFSSPCFMLGPSQEPSYRSTYNPRRTARSEEGFELTGHRMKGYENGLTRTGLSDIYPHVETPIRSQRRWTRNVFKDSPSPFSTSDPQALNQCLHVHQSIRLPLGTQDEAIKLKHFTQFVKKDGKVSFNNPYRKVKRKERRSLFKSDPHYQFDSVSSYIHFNRIYQQPSSDRSVAVHIPQLTGFPAHCTDTVLLRMMLEMNKPMRKSPDKYSDVAVQRDLEEYLMVRSPSAFSKTASARSKKNGRSKSGRSTAPVEEKGNCTWAGNLVQEIGQEEVDNRKEKEEVVEREKSDIEDGGVHIAKEEEKQNDQEVLEQKEKDEEDLQDGPCEKTDEAGEGAFVDDQEVVEGEKADRVDDYGE